MDIEILENEAKEKYGNIIPWKLELNRDTFFKILSDELALPLTKVKNKRMYIAIAGILYYYLHSTENKPTKNIINKANKLSKNIQKSISLIENTPSNHTIIKQLEYIKDNSIFYISREATAPQSKSSLKESLKMYMSNDFRQLYGKNIINRIITKIEEAYIEQDTIKIKNYLSGN